jgi:hypothetical protein
MNKIEMIELEKDINIIYKEIGIDKPFNYLNYHFIFTEYSYTDIKFKNNQYKTQLIKGVRLACFIDNEENKDKEPIDIGLTIHKIRLYLLRTQLTLKDYYMTKHNVNDIVYTLSVIANIHRNFKQLDNKLEHSSKHRKTLKI